MANRNTRLFQSVVLGVNQEISLTPEAQHHLRTVLRARVGDAITVFNGDGHDYLGTIVLIDKNRILVQLHATEQRITKSPLTIHLAQCINRGDKMDFVIQKATELGVQQITPIISEYGNVKLNEERWEKKLAHWRKVAENACEQSGRTDLVTINEPLLFATWIAQSHEGTCLILDPGAAEPIDMQKQIKMLTLLVGPEGGFSKNELHLAERHGFETVLLGPRILRSETAGLVAISVCQAFWGDLTYK